MKHISNMQRWRAVALVGSIATLVACAMVASAFAKSEQKFSGEVTVGLITSVSGPASVYYPAIKQINDLAVKEINAEGGVLGKKVKLIYADTKTTPAVAATQSRRLVQQGVKLMIVMDIVADRDAALPPTTQRNIPFVYAWSYEGGSSQQGTDTVCVKNFWATGQVPNNVVPQPIDYLMKNKGWKNVYLFGSDYKWPRTMNFHIANQIKKNGGKVLGAQYLPLGTSEFTALVTKLKSLPPDTKFINNLVGSDLIGFYKQWKAAGGDSGRTMSFVMDEQTLGATAGAAAGAYGSYDYYANRKNPGNVAFVKKLKAEYGSKAAVPTSLSTEGYEALHLWALAAKKAGSFDTDKINAALPTVSYFGPRDKVQWRPDRHMALPNILGVAGKGSYYSGFKYFGIIPPKPQCPLGTFK